MKFTNKKNWRKIEEKLVRNVPALKGPERSVKKNQNQASDTGDLDFARLRLRKKCVDYKDWNPNKKLPCFFSILRIFSTTTEKIETN